MHVAYFVNQYPKVSHSFIRREINALEELGVKVSRFALRTDGTESVDPRDAEELGKTRHVVSAGWLPIVASILMTGILHPLAFIRTAFVALKLGRESSRGTFRQIVCMAEACVLKRWIEACGATHLHAHFGTNSATVAMLCRSLGGVPYSVTIHGPEEFDMPRSLSLRRKVRDAAFVVAISSYCRSQIFRWAEPRDWQKVHVVRCALDLTEFKRTEGQGLAGRLVCVGRLCADKGQLLLVHALHRLVGRGVQVEVVFAGDGPLRGEIERLARVLGLERLIRITGWISGKQVQAELQQARAMVLPSFAEGLPVVIMEAMAAGRPVLSTFVAGIPELVADQDTGWLFPSGDVDQLSCVIEEAVQTDPVRLRVMGQRGRARVEEMHDVRREARHLATLFENHQWRSRTLGTDSPIADVHADQGERTAPQTLVCAGAMVGGTGIEPVTLAV